MPVTVLTATPDVANALSATADSAISGTYPDSTTYPAGNDPTALTVSGNEITDLTRAADLAWPKTQQGGSTDGLASPAGFGIWEAGTNLFRRGQCDATTDWNTALGTETRSIDATIAAPFSPQSIKVVTPGGATNEGILAQTATGQAAAAGVVGVGSIYFKGVAGQSYNVQLRWRNTDATITDGAATVVVATGAWQSVAPASLAVAVGKTGDQFVIWVRTATTRAESFWVAHAMLQKGVNVVSPYVATSGGATATRNAGRVRPSTSLLNIAQGWFAARVRVGFDSSRVTSLGAVQYVVASFGDSAGQEYVDLFYRAGSSDWRMRPIHLNASTGDAAIAAPFAQGDVVTVVGYWTTTQVAISVNGSAFVKTTPSAMPIAPTSPFFDVASLLGASNFNGNVLWFACGVGTLTNEDAATVNAFGDSPDPSLFPGLMTAVWPAITSLLAAPTPSDYLYPGRGSDLVQATDVQMTLTATPDV